MRAKDARRNVKGPWNAAVGQPNSNAELHIQLHLVEEILAEIKLVIDDRPFDYVNQTHKWCYKSISFKSVHSFDKLWFAIFFGN